MMDYFDTIDYFDEIDEGYLTDNEIWSMTNSNEIKGEN